MNGKDLSPERHEVTPSPRLSSLKLWASTAGFFTLFYGLLTAGTLWGIRRPPGFVATIVKPLEDSDAYLSFFNATAFGAACQHVLSPLFGFYSADVVLFVFWVSIATCATLALRAFFLLLRDQGASNLSDRPEMAGALALVFVLFNRKIFNLLLFFSMRGWLSATTWLEAARGLYRPYGSFFCRFYQPGIGYLGTLGALLAVGLLHAKRARPGAVALLAASVFLVRDYPWLATAVLGYLGLSLFGLRENRLGLYAVSAATLGLTVLLLAGFGKFNPDFGFRIAVEKQRLPSFEILWPNLLLLAASWPLLGRRLGREFARFQAATCAAISSCVVLGYYVQPWHYLHASALSAVLGLASLIDSGKLDRAFQKQRSSRVLGPLPKRAIISGALCLLGIIGLREQLFWKYPTHFLVPRSDVEKVERVQAECGPGKKEEYFFTDRVEMDWAIPARTLCRNLVYLGWGERGLSNAQIAGRYMAAMVYFGHYPSKDAFMDDLELHLAQMGSPQRELSRDQVKYDPQTRFYLHSLWYLFGAGFQAPGVANYLRDLFAGIDLDAEIAVIRQLDIDGKILRI